jgi:cytosine/adenosine deaminase-related metal-dependent hydrolase
MMIVRGGLAVETGQVTDFLVEDGLVRDVGRGLEVAGAEVVDAGGMLVLPGFVDTHRHTWQAGLRGMGADITFGNYLELVLRTVGPRYRPDDVYTGTLAGALECLDAGITTVVDWNHIQHTPDHTAAAVEALEASGIRAVFGYTRSDLGEARELRARLTGRITMAMAPFGPEIVGEDAALVEWRIARELDLPVTVHMGGHGAQSATRGLDFLRRHGFLAPRTSYAHGNHYSDDQLRLIADTGGTIAVSPVVEPELGIGVPVTARARRAGVVTGLGADTVISGPGDMFSLMRADYAQARDLTVRDILRSATADGATVAALDGVGALTPGSHADIVLLRTDLPGTSPVHDPVASVVLSMDTRAVDTVIVGGRVVKRGGVLLARNVSTLLTTLLESSTRLITTA